MCTILNNFQYLVKPIRNSLIDTQIELAGAHPACLYVHIAAIITTQP